MSDNPFLKPVTRLAADEIIAQLIVFCGNCGGKQHIVEGDDTVVSKLFVFECPSESCDRKATRTIIKFPRHLRTS